jgi:predicted ATP-grasp superfamily ATP-dependent carboligase
MLNPVRSGGGQGVRAWRDGRVPRSHYVQTFVEGWPGSVVFVAARGQAVVLGVTRQLVGDPAFGATGYRYCGSLLCAPAVEDVGWLGQAHLLAKVAAGAFGLVGAGGVDFVAGQDVVHPIEVNPRWTASLELVERARGISVFGLHADACRRGVLPAVNSLGSAGSHVYGKAIVFARHDVTAGDTRPWLRDDSVRDVPPPGTRIAAGQPVCTVFAAAADADACHAALVQRAQRVHGQLTKWNQEAA